MSRCIDCKHSRLIEQVGDGGQLACQYNPPQIIVLPEGKINRILSMYPNVDRHATCGHFAEPARALVAS